MFMDLDQAHYAKCKKWNISHNIPKVRDTYELLLVREIVKALNLAGMEDFTFHDLRHCALNNLRLAGNDRYVIKKASGHKTDSAFQWYILVTEDEMGGMKWLDQKKNSGTIDTYMDTNEHSINVQSL